MNFEQNLKARADLFKALGNPTRLLIVNLIRMQPRHTEELASILQLSAGTVSHHLSNLTKAGLLVSKKEQYRRFERRRNDPLRQWKLSEVDLQAQDLWDEFTEMKYRLLKKTHTSKNPWFVIRSDDKNKARLETMKLLLSSIPYRGRSRKLDFRLDPEVIIKGDKEVARMEKQRRKHGRFVR